VTRRFSAVAAVFFSLIAGVPNYPAPIPPGTDPEEMAVSVQTHDRRHSTPEHRAAYAATMKAPDEHKPKLITSHTGAQKVHGAGALGRFNTSLALLVTRSVGTMWAAYAFTALALISLPAAIASRSAIIIVAWIAQTFLQLVLLPIIIVGQNVISASQDARAEADHLTLTALHSMNVRQLEMLEQQRTILDQQHKILELMPRKA
jgi:hypothetical protein